MIDLVTDWYCPNCKVTDQTRGIVPNRFHHCAKLGLTAPLIRGGVKAKVEIHEREDYANADRIQTTSTGRPVMNVTTTRDDGTDVLVFAPTAMGKGS